MVKLFQKTKIISNEKINPEKLKNAQEIIKNLQSQMQNYTSKGSGPFIAAIYDEDNNIIAQASNSVVSENCSNNHAEMNAIKLAEAKLKSYDLSKFNLSIYITSEPCMMCIGAIMWSGIKHVYYGVKSENVEKITGFDEGFKPNWLKEFKKRGISVYGNIKPEIGEKVLERYVKEGSIIYKPER